MPHTPARRRRPSLVIAAIFAALLPIPPAGSVSAAPTLPAPPPLDAGEWYTPVVPARLLETRVSGSTIDGEFHLSRRVQPGETISVDVLGRGGVPAADVDAVVVNVTAINPTAATHITVFPAGATKPEASNLNASPGTVIPNLVVAKVGAGGRVSLFNAFGTIDLVVDVAGYFPTTDGFTPLLPARLLDTRPNQPDLDGRGRPGSPLGPQTTLDLPVLGRGGIPAGGVEAVVVNVTAVNPSEPSFLTVYPKGAPLPTASNLNLNRGVTRPNLVVAKVGADGQISLYNHAGDVHVIADVAGYFPTGGNFHALTPTRVFETRPDNAIGTGGTNLAARVPAGYPIDIDLSAVPGIDDSVSAVVLNVTAINPSDPSHITAWPTGRAMPNASNLNLARTTTAPNLVVAKMGAGGHVSLYNHGGSVDVAIDLAGFFDQEAGWLRTVDTSERSTCASDWLGEVHCWGSMLQDPPYYYGRGDGLNGEDNTISVYPYRLSVFDDVLQVGVGISHTCVLRADGTVWCWTSLDPWGLAGTPDAEAVAYPPKKVPGLDGIVEIAAGSTQSCALRNDGTVWCWGKDFTGTVRTPWKVPGLTDVEHVSLDSVSACALRTTGTVACWGILGSTGVLGDGSGTDSPSSPRPVAGLTDADWVEVSGLRACATRTTGQAVCWGNSMLGDGTVGPSLTPVPVIDAITGLPVDDIVQIDGGDDYVCTLREDAKVYCWGTQFYGDLGLAPDPDNATTTITTPIVGLPATMGIFADRAHICAETLDGELYCWGANDYGAVGNGTLVTATTPQPIFAF